MKPSTNSRHTRLVIDIRWSGEAQKQDVEERLKDSAAFLYEEGLLTPVHDCELGAWSCQVMHPRI